jgi:hypothetical protein
MTKPLTISIHPNDIYPILEALEYYRLSWEATEICRRYGYQPDDDPVHVFCFDPDEAHKQMLQVKGVLRRFHRALDRANKAQAG